MISQIKIGESLASPMIRGEMILLMAKYEYEFPVKSRDDDPGSPESISVWLSLGSDDPECYNIFNELSIEQQDEIKALCVLDAYKQKEDAQLDHVLACREN